MKTLDIKDQVRLGFARTLGITAKGVRYRLFRSAVTVAVVAVSTAFLMNTLSESLIMRAVARHTAQRIGERHLAFTWAARLARPPGPRRLLEEFSAARPGDPAYDQTVRFGQFAEADAAAFHSDARGAVLYLRFFDGLDYGRRRQLVHTAGGIEIFDRLADPQHRETFRTTLKPMRSVRFVTTQEALDDFLGRWPSIRQRIEQVRSGHAAAITKVDKARGTRSGIEALADADGDFGRAVQAAGFPFEADRLGAKIAGQARQVLDTRRMAKSLDLVPLRQAIAQRNSLLPGNVTTDMMWRTIRDLRSAAWYLDKMKTHDADANGLDADRIVLLARGVEEERRLARAGQLTARIATEGTDVLTDDDGQTGAWLGLGPRMGWLILVSMFVCVIGITNAMLMSVTERFAQIATMKCLGALDGFIMLMFVLESCFMGVVGGILGALIGATLGVLRMTGVLGTEVLRVPVQQLVIATSAATAVGVLLSAVAAVYPALRAARLAPMEAMRIQ